MQNHRAVEAIYSATYVEDYTDAVDHLPDEIQRQLTRMRELDIRYQSQLADVNASMKKLLTINSKVNRNEEEEKNLTTTRNKIQRLLMNIQEIGDDKIQIGQHIQDYTENRLRQLELDKKTLDQTNRSEAHAQESMMQHHSVPRDSSSKEGASEGRAPKRARRARLDPSMSLNGPTSAKATSNTHHNAVIEKRAEVQPPSASVSTPVAPPEPGPSVSTPAASTPIAVSTTVTTTPSTAAVTTPTPAPKAARTPGAVGGAGGRRDSEASTSGSAATTPYSKKQSVDSSSGAASSEPPERERKESVTTRTPKKQYNQQKQKAAEKRAAVAAATKKKRTRQMEIDDSPPANLPVDPDEPTYCLCDQVSYGDMIGCDNDLCPLEWFHFNCVNLSMKPKGKWFCPKCRGDRQNVMKPRAQFMKELEKYNREKEEKP